MKEKKEYQIRIPGRLVPVSKEVYLAYYRMARREQFVFEKDRRAGVAYYSDLDTDEILGEETIPDLAAPTVETVAVTQVMRESLRKAGPTHQRGIRVNPGPLLRKYQRTRICRKTGTEPARIEQTPA